MFGDNGLICMDNIAESITLGEHLNKSGVDENMSKLILLISNLAKPISDAFHGVNSGDGSDNQAGTKNMYGEDQLELDKWADHIIIDKLKKSELVRHIASEEQSEIIEIKNSKGLFGVVMDPLDGSSLIGVNFAVGTIVGIYDEGNPLEPGKNMDAALYLMYGPLTVLVYSAGQDKGVHEFALKDNEFRLLKENIKIPEGKIMAPGALRKDYFKYHKEYISDLESKGFKLRYSGAFVSDVHQILHKGGVFCYPATVNYPRGKLRLIFEGNPMSFIIRAAGGAASDGQIPLHEIVPSELGERVPIYIGSKSVVELINSKSK